ncbi:hypothetical protein QYF36_025324 [Acer negundo]|nr:hypothetical protein QYF36_025324 [Acer negundo]
MDPWLYYVPEIDTSGDNQYRLVPNYKLAFLLLIPYPIFIAHRMIIRPFVPPNEPTDKEGIVKHLTKQSISQGYPGIAAFVFGGMWYSFAIKKKVGCWNNACIHGKENCSLVNGKYLQIGYNIKNTTYLDDSCNNKNLGIFKDAFESGIVETKHRFLVKLVYGFRWGLQNLSGFGQNLEPSTYVWENIFVIFIVVYGVAMFTYFIGNMQEAVSRAYQESNHTTACQRTPPCLNALAIVSKQVKALK